MKPTDKAILGMVSKSPGRNASEPTGGLENLNPGGRAPCARAKAAWPGAKLTGAPGHSGGGVGVPTVTAQNRTLSVVSRTP